jgi:hypothetical protein
VKERKVDLRGSRFDVELPAHSVTVWRTSLTW